ncbi:MAG: ABC transporter substrate-binding protein [Clostridiales bacterium]|nr:ABC transporter substrate-binding protein [Clostridiales bacterium]
MKKKLMALILIPVVLLAFSSCKRGTVTDGTPSPATDGETMIFTDSAGRQVEISKNITRIVASGYPAQLVLFSLAPDKLVGLAEAWSDSALEIIDPKYHDLPVLGSFYGSGDLNLEEIAVRAPQVIIDVGEPKSSIVEDMDSITEQVGIPAVHIEASLDSMPEAYRMLGKLLDMEEEAEELALYCENVLTETRGLAEQLGRDGMKSLLYCMGSDGLNVIAQGTFHAQVIDRLSNNLAVIENASSKGTGNPVDMEQLLNWDPEVIIFAPDSIYDTVREDETWRQLQAISAGNYYEIPIGPYNWMSFPPSVNRYLGMIWLTGVLYPETATFDVYEEASKFFELFYHTNLTEEQFKELTKNSLS